VPVEELPAVWIKTMAAGGRRPRCPRGGKCRVTLQPAMTRVKKSPVLPIRIRKVLGKCNDMGGGVLIAWVDWWQVDILLSK